MAYDPERMPRPPGPSPIVKRYLDGETTADEETQLSIDLEPLAWRNLQGQRLLLDRERRVREVEASVPRMLDHLSNDQHNGPDDLLKRLCRGLALLIELQLQANQHARKPK